MHIVKICFLLRFARINSPIVENISYFLYLSFAGLKNNGRTMTSQKCLLTGYYIPVILTGPILTPSARIRNLFFSSAYLLKYFKRKTVYFLWRGRNYTTRTSIYVRQKHCLFLNKTLPIICWLNWKGSNFVLL